MSEIDVLKDKIKNQNKKINDITQNALKEQENLSNLLSTEIETFEECLSRVQKINPYSSTNPLEIGLESKIQEFQRLIEQNNGNYDEKEKKIQNLINHIFNNKNNELIINKKLEESKNKEDIKALKKIKFSKIKVNSYNLLIPNQKNKKIKNKR